ncbi:MAG: UDP-N-acetylmuramoyl-L-alanine--D-glutamate ligase [Parachlamydiaceae bacterium]|nr:UDP-N-acetylmuramoyl-L-alanine--D-glutamate ligase [Parachlamydiaceae bacterium]
MQKTNYSGKKTLVVGLGASGRAAAFFLLKKGAIVYGVDRNATQLLENPEIISLIKDGLTVQVDDPQLSLDAFDHIIMSPGIPPTHPIYARALLDGKEVLGEIELGCRDISNRIVGITGTNGKTTVTLLITHILNQCGKKAHALGNVGMPLTREILTVDPDDILVLELSSYQLETLHQKVLDVAVILNITPDHLERYKTMDAYAKAKFFIGRNLKDNGILYLEENISKDYATVEEVKKGKIYGYNKKHEVHTDLKSIFVKGVFAFDLPKDFQGHRSHDVENIMAAYAICQHLGVAPNQFLSGLQTFKKPPHRIEFVLEKSGVRYFDDSKGTNVDAVIRAVQTLQGSIILIAGGVDKGSSYTPWLNVFVNKVKCICAIGQAANKIQHELSHSIPVQILNSLDDAVISAAKQAKSGDIVLLSPGCASYDMFRDYAHRGEEFQRAVRQL